MKAGFGHSAMDECRIDAPASACKRSKECEQVPRRLEGSAQSRRTAGPLRWCQNDGPVERQESSRQRMPGGRNDVASACHLRHGRRIASLVPSDATCQAGQQLLPAVGQSARVLLQQPWRHPQTAQLGSAGAGAPRRPAGLCDSSSCSLRCGSSPAETQAQLSGSHCAVSLGISLSQPRGLS